MRTLIHAGMRVLCAAVVFVALTAHLSYAQTRVENVWFEQREEKVYVFYDLYGSEESYEVRVKLSSDGGQHFDISPKSLSGDVGEAVAPGKGKRIIWDALKDVEELSGERFVFAVTASWEGIEGMVFIRGGTFEMGDMFGDGDSDEKPVHTVTVDDFYMDATEVTVAQFREFCQATGRKMPEQPDWNKDNHPVVNVTWHDAVAYAQWAGKRLPTEAEWEYAARSRGKKVKFPNGNTLTPRDANYDPGNYTEDGYRYTAPVGSFPPNELGLYDMAGNVWEWCADWYDSGYYSKSPQYNPTGPATGTYRVLRGGSWSSAASYCRAAVRGWINPSGGGNLIGFRCARTP